MNRQSTVIFGALLLAFFIFITVRGDLPEWISLFSKTGQHTSSTIQETATTEKKSGGGIFGKILGIASAATSFIPGLGPAVKTAGATFGVIQAATSK